MNLGLGGHVGDSVQEEQGISVGVGLHWWFISERVRNKGCGRGLEVHLEMRAFSGGACRKQSVLCHPGQQPGGQVWESSYWLQIPFHHSPTGSLQTTGLASEGFLNYKMGVITAPRQCQLVSMDALSEGEGGLCFIL